MGESASGTAEFSGFTSGFAAAPPRKRSRRSPTRTGRPRPSLRTTRAPLREKGVRRETLRRRALGWIRFGARAPPRSVSNVAVSFAERLPSSRSPSSASPLVRASNSAARSVAPPPPQTRDAGVAPSPPRTPRSRSQRRRRKVPAPREAWRSRLTHLRVQWRRLGGDSFVPARAPPPQTGRTPPVPPRTSCRAADVSARARRSDLRRTAASYRPFPLRSAQHLWARLALQAQHLQAQHLQAQHLQARRLETRRP